MTVHGRCHSLSQTKQQYLEGIDFVRLGSSISLDARPGVFTHGSILRWWLVNKVNTAEKVSIFEALPVWERRLSIGEKISERCVSIAAQIDSTYVAAFVARKSTPSALVAAHTIAHGARENLLHLTSWSFDSLLFVLVV